MKIFHAFIQKTNNPHWKKKILQLQFPHPKKTQVKTICSPPSSSFYVTIKINAYNLLYKYEAASIQLTEHSENISSIKSTLDNCKNKVPLFLKNILIRAQAKHLTIPTSV